MFNLKSTKNLAFVSLASIPALILLTLLLVSQTSAAAENGSVPIALPELGNTELDDAKLSREVSDQFIWKPSALAMTEGGEQIETAWDLILAAPRLPYHLHPKVDSFIATAREDAWWIEKILNRARPYLQFILVELQARGLPMDLAMIPVIESSFQPHVTSSGAAAGLWQIVPVTARQIGLERTLWIDARASLRDSTRAALDYLSYLNGIFKGDWELALAAYNAGPGRVKAAMARNRKAGKATDYWSLPLPQETRNYVPKLIAVIELLRQTPSSAFKLPHIPTAAAFEEIDVGQRISLDIAANLAGIKQRRLRALNAELIHNVTPPRGPHKILLPVSAVAQFTAALSRYKAEETRQALYVLPITHSVVAGDSIGSIALEYGISQKQLRELNALKNDLIRIGQKLAVVDARTTKPAARQTTPPPTSNQSETLATRKAAINYIIQKGDTLSGIAHKFKVRVKSITLADGSNPNERRLIPGQKLLIPASVSKKRG